MTQFFQVHPVSPQPRLVGRAVDIIRGGGVVVYPTDSGHAMGCHIGDREAMERIRSIRGLDHHHDFTLLCRNLSEVAIYARVGNADYRVLRAHTPGAYTFVLPATREVPRRLLDPKRKTIGVRIPQHPITLALLAELGEPIMSVSLIFPGQDLAPSDPQEIRDRLQHAVDLVIDGGQCGSEPTTVIALSGGLASIVRHGKGDIAPFALAESVV